MKHVGGLAVGAIVLTAVYLAGTASSPDVAARDLPSAESNAVTISQQAVVPMTVFGTGLGSGQVVAAYHEELQCATSTVDADGNWTMQIGPDTCNNLGPGSLITFTLDGSPRHAIVFWYEGGTPSSGPGNGWPIDTGVDLRHQLFANEATRLNKLEGELAQLRSIVIGQGDTIVQQADAIIQLQADLTDLEFRMNDLELRVDAIEAGGVSVDLTDVEFRLTSLETALANTALIYEEFLGGFPPPVN